MNIGNGWRIVHKTDRTVELRKDDATYRRLVRRDGYVLVRVEPGTSEQAMMQEAIARAQESDAAIAEIVAQRIMPRHVTRFHDQQRQLARAFGIPGQEPSEKVYRP